MGKIDEVAALVALEERAKLGRENFLRRKGRNVGLAGEPRIRDGVGDHARRLVGRDFLGVDFDLYADRHVRGFVLGRNAETQFRSHGLWSNWACPIHGSQDPAHGIENGSDGTRRSSGQDRCLPNSAAASGNAAC